MSKCNWRVLPSSTREMSVIECKTKSTWPTVDEYAERDRLEHAFRDARFVVDGHDAGDGSMAVVVVGVDPSRVEAVVRRHRSGHVGRLVDEELAVRASKKAPKRSAKKAPKRSAKKAPKRSAKKAPKRSAKKAPKRSAKKSAKRPTKKAPKRSAKKSAKRPAKKAPKRANVQFQPGDVVLVNRNVWSTTPYDVEFFKVLDDGNVRWMTKVIHKDSHDNMTAVSPSLPYKSEAVPPKFRKPAYGVVSKWNGQPYAVVDPRTI